MEKVRQSNQACHEGDFRKAIVLYGEALSVDPQNCILYSNRSAVYMKTQQYHEALDDAIRARLLNPKWPKGGRMEGAALPRPAPALSSQASHSCPPSATGPEKGRGADCLQKLEQALSCRPQEPRSPCGEEARYLQ
uniref:Uncharacterized protein n=1 Tax=Varanus komodoensis TaxID=61221 RepID=A0A8D2KSM8_VARKO